MGYVSPDFRRHPVGYFMRPIFAHHDQEQFEVFVYSGLIKGDRATEFFRSRTNTWRDVYALDDEAPGGADSRGWDRYLGRSHAAHGATLGCSLSRQPGTVQVTYLGYPHSTGLCAMDYKLSDSFIDPVGTTEAFHTEQIARLPGTYFCCDPDAEEPAMPVVGELPAKKNGFITFASFNTLMKIADVTVETWCGAFTRGPEIEAHDHRRRAGRDQRRRHNFGRGLRSTASTLIDLHSPIRLGVEHGLAALQQADIALDSFPYTGGTTTCNCLWMGVPVVTLAGISPVGRQGVSFLTNVGLPELIATTTSDYVATGAALANDLNRLAAIRGSLPPNAPVRSPMAPASRSISNRCTVACGRHGAAAAI